MVILISITNMATDLELSYKINHTISEELLLFDANEAFYSYSLVRTSYL